MTALPEDPLATLPLLTLQDPSLWRFYMVFFFTNGVFSKNLKLKTTLFLHHINSEWRIMLLRHHVYVVNYHFSDSGGLKNGY